MEPPQYAFLRIFRHFFRNLVCVVKLFSYICTHKRLNQYILIDNQEKL